jgi:hypothetical protein
MVLFSYQLGLINPSSRDAFATSSSGAVEFGFVIYEGLLEHFSPRSILNRRDIPLYCLQGLARDHCNLIGLETFDEVKLEKCLARLAAKFWTAV